MAVEGLRGTTPLAPANPVDTDLPVSKPQVEQGPDTGTGVANAAKADRGSDAEILKARLGISDDEVLTVARNDNDREIQDTLQEMKGQPGKAQVTVGAPTMQDVKDAKSVYELQRDILDVGFTTAKAGIAEAKSHLQSIQDQVRSVARQVMDGKMSLPKARGILADLQSQQAGALKRMAVLEKALGNPRVAQLHGYSDVLQELKECKGKAGKALFGLDAACNLVDLQAMDPTNPGKNLTEAITMSAGKFTFDVKTAGTKLNVMETSVGVLKTGLQLLGEGDSATYKSVDAISQALPCDIVSKGFGEMVEIAHASASSFLTGNTRDFERLNRENLNGDHGLVMCGAAVIGDLLATGGGNIPLTNKDGKPGDAIGLGEAVGLYGNTSIPTDVKAYNANAKARLVKELIDSSQPDDVLKKRNLLTYGPPAQIAGALEKTDKNRLVRGMSSAEYTNMIRDLIQRTTSPKTPTSAKLPLTKQVMELIQAADRNQRGAVAAALKSMLAAGQLGSGVPPQIRTTLDNCQWDRDFYDGGPNLK